MLRVPFLIAQRALKVPFFDKVTVPFSVPGVNTNQRPVYLLRDTIEYHCALVMHSDIQ